MMLTSSAPAAGSLRVGGQTQVRKDVSSCKAPSRAFGPSVASALFAMSKGGEVFFHHTALPSPDYFAALTIGIVVEFEGEPSPKGPRATRVMRMPERC